MAKQESKMHLPTIDDLFTTQEERDNANLEKVVDIKIADIDDFPQHPFQVIKNAEMDEMVESIKSKGVLVPAIVRKKENGKYEMISGHRRKKASELADLDTIPCIVRDLSDDEATIIMVDSNLQREKLLPSEKAFAYKLKMEALSHQGKITSRQVVEKSITADIIGKGNNESGRQVQRYIRLTYLLPKLLKNVDNSVIKDSEELSIALSPAVEISFLKREEQKSLLDYIEFNQITPSQHQAIELKKMSESNTFTIEKMEKILDVEKPNQTPALKVSMNKLKPVLPSNLKNDKEREDYVIKAVVFYDKHQKKLKERNEQAR